MSSKHTPGPWGIEQTDDTNWIGFMRPHGMKVELIVCTTARDSLTDEALNRNDANARLIAAAPEMLEALRSAMKQLDSGIQLQCGAPDEPPQPASQWDYEAGLMAYDLGRLIAKATGAA